MRHISIKRIYFFLLVLIGALAQVQVSYGQFNKNGVVAHRGAWKGKKLPQNSIAALQEAARLDCYGSEFDVHLTKDNIPVVNHDHDFMGLPIETLNYSDLLAKSLPNGEKLPTLKEYIQEGLKHPDIRLWLDIKSSQISKERTVQLGRYCAEVIKELGAEDRVEVIAPNFEALVKVLMVAPKAKVLYIGADKEPEVLKALGFWGVDLGYKRFNAGEYSVKASREAGLRVGSYTVDKEEDMKQQLASGVHFITTNDPELLLKVLKNQGL